MTEQDFLAGLKSDDEKREEFYAAAEAFARQKGEQAAQDGRDPGEIYDDLPDFEDLPMSKQADTLRDIGTQLWQGASLPLTAHKESAKGLVETIKRVIDSPDKAKHLGAAAGYLAPFLLLYYLGKRAGRKEKEKTAALKDLLPSTTTAAMMALGATAGGVGTYLSTRPGASGKSKGEEDFDEILAAQKARGPAKDYNRKLRDRFNEFSAGVAQANREHPSRAVLAGALAGAAAGAGASRLLGAGKSALQALRRPG